MAGRRLGRSRVVERTWCHEDDLVCTVSPITRVTSLKSLILSEFSLRFSVYLSLVK